MVGRLDMYPEWRSFGWLPVAGDGFGNCYVLAQDGTIGFVEAVVDPDRIQRHVSSDLLSFMIDMLAADQALPPPG
jgi:hypothetical protein